MMIKRETTEQMMELMMKDGNMERAKAFLALEIGHRRAYEKQEQKSKK